MLSTYDLFNGYIIASKGENVTLVFITNHIFHRVHVMFLVIFIYLNYFKIYIYNVKLCLARDIYFDSKSVLIKG